MRSETNIRKAARRLLSAIWVVICVASALLSLAVILAFSSRRTNLATSSLSARHLVVVGVALFLVAVSVLGIEARKARRARRTLTVAALLCAAGGSLLVWSAFDQMPATKAHHARLAEASRRVGSGRKLPRGGGSAGSKNERRHSMDQGRRPQPHSEPGGGSEAEQPAAEASSAEPLDECGCSKVEEPYVQPPPVQPESSPPQEEGWREDEKWGDAEEGWSEAEETGWEEEEWEETGWEEEEWEEEGW